MVFELDPHLEVITGCMSSGKSEELIRRLTRAKIVGLKTIVFKPAKDTRTGAEIKSRSGSCVLATIVKEPQEILNLVDGHDLIGIDEGHFFSSDLVDVVVTLVRRGKHVIVAGLDLDYKEDTFGPMGAIMAKAYPIHKLTAVCMKCKKNYATRSQRLVDCQDVELVGDKEYEPRCLKCYEPPNGETNRP